MAVGEDGDTDGDGLGVTSTCRPIASNGPAENCGAVPDRAAVPSTDEPDK